MPRSPVGAQPTTQQASPRRRLGERPVLGAVTVAALALLAALALRAVPIGTRAFGLLLALAVVITVFSLARRWPLPVMTMGAIATIIEVWEGSRVVPFCILLAIGVYLVAHDYPRRVSVPCTLVVALGIGGAIWHATTLPFAPLGIETTEGLLPLCAAFFIGDSLAARRRYLAGLAEQAARERAAEVERARLEVREERVRIARELHDVVAHALAVITVQAGVGRRLMARQPEQASSALESIEGIGRTAQEELGVVLALLREDDAAAALVPAPRLADLREMVSNITVSGTPVGLLVTGSEVELSPAVELTVFRIVQEALTNVVKHAPGSNTLVKLDLDAREVRIEVVNEQGARQVVSERAPAGNGLLGMRERIEAFGGTLEAGPLPSGGFGVAAHLPLDVSP